MVGNRSTEEVTSPDLPTAILNEIRDDHATVNKLNKENIPLCLPPYADTPALYAIGFFCYADIYLGFEEAWCEQTNGTNRLDSDYADDTACSMSHDKRISHILEGLDIRGLRRSDKILADRNFFARQGVVSSSPPSLMKDTRENIKKHAMQKPHILVAYIWVLYSALFNGGRWIRGQLLKAGHGFWGFSTPNELEHFLAPLSFWQVDECDTVKTELRHRIIEAGKALTPTERQDVLDEALEIFRLCNEMTRKLQEAELSG